MLKRIPLLFTLLFTLQSTFAQEIVWPEDNSEINTGSNATYLIQAVSLEGNPVLYGYNLGAFYTNDLGVLTCAGIVSWSGGQTTLAVYGDDATTPEKDGFSEGEQITWLAYATFTQQTYNVEVELGVGPTGMGSEIFSNNSINIVTSYNITSALVTTVEGCMDANACNYLESAQEDDGSCEYPQDGYNCDGICIDMDEDGICDIEETSGCTDPEACNYIFAATLDDGSCIFAELNFDCDGNCIDEDQDDVCDIDEIPGCTDSLYTEFNELATEDDGSCATLIIHGCTIEDTFNYNPLANINDSTCLTEVEVAFEVTPTNSTINYNVSPESISLNLGNSTIETGDIIGGFIIINGQLTCIGFAQWSTEDLSLSVWLDDINTPEIDGYIDGETIYWIAQQNNTLFNYLLEFTTVEIASNIFVTEIYVNDTIIIGCQDETAYNYNEDATLSDGACVPFIYDCIDSEACNFNPEANTDDGSCYYITATLSELTPGNPLTVNTDAETPTFNWYLNGELQTDTLNTYTPYVNGEYIVEVTDYLGCIVTDTLLLTNVSLLERLTNEVIIYPVPATNQLTIDSKNEIIKSVELYSVDGKLLKTLKPNSNKLIIEKGNLNNGIYYLKLEFSDSIIQKPILFK
jgi:hypothetical protein